MKPWLHSFLPAGAYFTCVQVDFVNVHFVWEPMMEVGGVRKAKVLIFVGMLRLLPALQNCYSQGKKKRRYNFQIAFHGHDFPHHLACWILAGCWCLDVLETPVTLFNLKVGVLFGWVCDVLAIGRYDCCNFKYC